MNSDGKGCGDASGADHYRVSDARERGNGNIDAKDARAAQPLELEAAAVKRGAKMIRLTPTEAREFGLDR